jgi:hypothetical protein
MPISRTDPFNHHPKKDWTKVGESVFVNPPLTKAEAKTIVPGIMHALCLIIFRLRSMMTDSEIRRLFDSACFRQAYASGDHPTALAALPDASLDFLVALAQQLDVLSVFEFGSGRSTAALLRAGFSVTSLEDSSHWMEQTQKQLSDADRCRHIPLVRPLRFRMHGLFPVMDWSIDRDLAKRLNQADLILVDSPFLPPFRESTLWSALLNNNHAVIVLDDTRIPTLARFCDRITTMNPQLLHCRVAVGHTFDLFARIHDATPLRRSQTTLDVLKGWRRFMRALTMHGSVLNSA